MHENVQPPRHTCGERKQSRNAVDPLHAQTTAMNFSLRQQQGSQASGESGSYFAAQLLLRGSVFFRVASQSPPTVDEVLAPTQTRLLNLGTMIFSPLTGPFPFTQVLYPVLITIH